MRLSAQKRTASASRDRRRSQGAVISDEPREKLPRLRKAGRTPQREALGDEPWNFEPVQPSMTAASHRCERYRFGGGKRPARLPYCHPVPRHSPAPPRWKRRKRRRAFSRAMSTERCGTSSATGRSFRPRSERRRSSWRAWKPYSGRLPSC
jgi:hypothetical protein